MATFNGRNWTVADMVPFKYVENWDPFFDDVIAEMEARSEGVGEASEAAVAAAAQAVPAAATATTQAAIAVAAANTAAGIVQVKQPSEIAGIDPVVDFPFRASTAVPAGVITGSSGKWVFNQAGVLVNVASGTAPIDFDPVTSALRGLLAEESRVNQVRNPRGEGSTTGTVGSGGVLPTNWAISASGGLSTAVVGTGIANGLPYVDLRFFGTSSGTFYVFRFDTISAALSTGQQWVTSLYASIVGGGLTNISSMQVATGTTGASGGQSATIVPTSGFARYQAPVTTLLAGTTAIDPRLVLNFASGAAVDVTIRIQVPQLELGAFAMSPILPPVGSPAATTRSVDVNTLLLSSIPGWNALEGTIYVEAIAPPLAANYPMFVSLNDGTASNCISVYKAASASAVLFCDALSGGVSQSLLNAGSLSAGSAFKAAFSFKAGAFAASLNGAAAVTSATGSVPSLTRVEIGSRAGSLSANTAIRRITLFPRALSNAILQLLTA